MNENKAKENSLSTLAQAIIPLLNGSDSADRVLDAVENFELDIQDLEARIEIIQQEIAVLISEQ